jgi:hypothetical protein
MFGVPDSAPMSAIGIACAEEMPAAEILARKKAATSLIIGSLVELVRVYQGCRPRPPRGSFEFVVFSPAMANDTPITSR